MERNLAQSRTQSQQDQKTGTQFISRPAQPKSSQHSRSQRTQNIRLSSMRHGENLRTASVPTPKPELDLHADELTSTVPMTSSNILKITTIDLEHLHRSTMTTDRETVHIVRGNDGFGFTICSDGPVRVQAVDAGGPAHQAGLCQGDLLLQLNGIAVETWKCVELAHTIRRCSSHIILVLWRTSLESSRNLCQTQATPPDARLHPLWRDNMEPQQDFIHTLKGTRVTSSIGGNYIILSPVRPGGTLLQERWNPLSRLYQTQAIRGQQLLSDLRPLPLPYSSQTVTGPPPTAVTSVNTSNYQNCTMVQSHRRNTASRSSKPQTVIFPISIQPVDLCSSDRTLLLSENMMLLPTQQLPRKVTVFVYSDLLLLTAADSVGRFLVLQSPLVLRGLQLREVSSEPLCLYLLQSTTSGWCCPVCLEAFSIEQKVRVSLCLHDNMQFIAPEMYHRPQKKTRKEELEKEQEEGKRCSEMSDHRRWSLQICSAHFPTRNAVVGEEEKQKGKAAGLLHALSEGSLLKEPRSPRFLSDSSIHHLSRTLTSDPCDPHTPLPSLHTVRKQLTRVDESLKELPLLFNNSKSLESTDKKLKTKKKSLSVELLGHLSFLHKRNNANSFHANRSDRALRNNRPSEEEVLKWAESLEALLANQYGVAVFRYFLRSEFSEENLDFWLAVERFKRTPPPKMEAYGQKIYRDFICTDAARQVNVDSFIRESTNQSIRQGVGPASFDQAQEQVFNLMMCDSYPRFLKSHLYTTLTNHSTAVSEA